MHKSQYVSTVHVSKLLALLLLPLLVSACNNVEEKTRDDHNQNNHNNSGHNNHQPGHNNGGGLNAEGKNACGGTRYLDGGPGNSCGECGTGVWTCTDINQVVCSNDRGCTSPIVEMLNITDITTDSANLLGSWTKEGQPRALSLGFCFTPKNTPNTQPTHENGAQCFDVDFPDGPGAFSGKITAELLPGTTYAVAPFASQKPAGADSPRFFYGHATEFISAPDAPQNLTATPDENSITVHWDPVPGAVSYHVFRDGDSWAFTELDAPQTNFTDDRASNGFQIAPELTVISSDNTIELKWGMPTPQPGHPHTYKIIARNADGLDSLPAEISASRLAGPFTEIRVVALRNGYMHPVTTVYPEDAIDGIFTATDPEAQPATLTLTNPTASNATHPDYVLLESQPAFLSPAPEYCYYLEIYDKHTDFVHSHSDEIPGQRTPGPISYKWERKEAAQQDFAPLDICETQTPEPDSEAPLTCKDTTASSNGTPYDYRLIATAPGTQSTVSPNTASGSRATLSLDIHISDKPSVSQGFTTTITVQNQYFMALPDVEVTLALYQENQSVPVQAPSKHVSNAIGKITASFTVSVAGDYSLQAQTNDGQLTTSHIFTVSP